MLPVIAFGTLKLLETYQDELEAQHGSREVPPSPGCFALSEPYEGMVLIIHDHCPARYVNDAIGRQGITKNVQFLQHRDPRSLFYDHEKGLQLFLQLEATRDIEAGEELCCAYGHHFWDVFGIPNVKCIDENMKPLSLVQQLEKDAKEEAEEEEKRAQEEEKATQEEAEALSQKEKAKRNKKLAGSKQLELTTDEHEHKDLIHLTDDETEIEDAPTPNKHQKTPSSTNKRFFLFGICVISFIISCKKNVCVISLLIDFVVE
jgi:hypothetical protein